MLTDRLKPAIRRKCQGLLSIGVVLLHNNARPHTAAQTAETLRKLKFEVNVHPPYSPDLAPSDYHLFGPLKEALRGSRFTSDQEVKEAVHAWLAAQPKTFLSEGIDYDHHRSFHFGRAILSTHIVFFLSLSLSLRYFCDAYLRVTSLAVTSDVDIVNYNL